MVLTTFDADEYVLRALRAGAAGFLLKSTPRRPDRPRPRGRRGHTVLSPRPPRGWSRVDRGDRRPEQAAARSPALTEREAEVLSPPRRGALERRRSAPRLYLSEATVKGYVSAVLDKLDCDNRTQAGLLAFAAGWAAPL